MSLDNIQLSPLLVEKLYSKTLVDLNPAKAASENKPASNLNWLGKNKKNILIVVNEPGAAYLQDDDLQLLLGILTACKLSSTEDIALLNFYTNKHADYAGLNEALNPSTIILFGVEPSALDFPLHFPHFQLQAYNGQHYLSSPALNELAANVALKKQLWLSLQKHFN